VLLLGFVAFRDGLNVPGGTLIMLTGGRVPGLLPVGGGFPLYVVLQSRGDT